MLRPEAFYYHIFPPDPKLTNQVHHYWVLKDPDLDISKPELLLPDGTAEIIFNRNQIPYQRWSHRKPEHSIHLRESYIIANDGSSVLAQRLGKIDMIGIKLSTSGLNNLLGIPASEFAIPIDLNLLNHKLLNQLNDQLSEIEDPKLIKRLLDQFLIEHLQSPGENHFSAALRLIHASRGRIDIRDLTTQLNIHYSTLERSFHKQGSMSPKAYQRMVRFRHCFAQFLQEGLLFLKRSSYLNFGYFDQTHFIKEFKYFINCTPRQHFLGNVDFSNEVYEAQIASGALSSEPIF